MDGIDIVAVRFPENTKLEIVCNHFSPYPADLKQRLQDLATDPKASLNSMCHLDTLLGKQYAQQIQLFIEKYQLDRHAIHAIGSHGQTVRHQPDDEHPYTLQIGDPNIIAAATGITTVADFRRRDIALGGQGAPLAPAFHQYLFADSGKSRAIINIGGIANVTILPNNSTDTVGFDTGPGNTLIDYLCQHHYSKNFDDSGSIARSGNIDTDLLEKILLREPYFSKPSPKSTGTDYFSPDWLKAFGFLDLPAKDAIATITELTAVSIQQCLPPVDEYYICGGGAKNDFLKQRLAFHLKSGEIFDTSKLGLHPDWVEAVAFAWLAYQTLNRRQGNLPSVTHARQGSILGAVYY